MRIHVYAMLIIAALALAIAAGYTLNRASAAAISAVNESAGVSAVPVPAAAPAVTNTAAPTPTPANTPASAPVSPVPNTATFDFDTSLPVLSAGQGTPFNQTSNGVTAQFSSPSDTAAFSVQNHDTTFYTLSQFSGNYLVESKPLRNYLYIAFNRTLTGISLGFATAEYHGVGEVETPTSAKMTIYMDSVLVGSAAAHGNFTGDSFPQGVLSFNGRKFNMVRIELPYKPDTNFFIDNVVVTKGS